MKKLCKPEESRPTKGGGIEFPFPILYRTNQLLVINKPAGLSVHAGPAGGASVEDAFSLLPQHRRGGPWLAHRLDTDTSGCLVIALRKSTLVAAQSCFAEGRARKTYWAVVQGYPGKDEGRIDVGISKINDSRGWRMVADPKGMAAITDWKVLGRHNDRTWLELTLKSGRTHQARVHCAALGCPIVGDPFYGRSDATGLNLMSQRIVLPIEPVVDVTAPPPAHMITALTSCGWKSDILR